MVYRSGRGETKEKEFAKERKLGRMYVAGRMYGKVRTHLSLWGSFSVDV